MANVISGERVGKHGRLAVGCSAIVFDFTRQKVLLTRRADNGQWCVPGGYMEPGESITEACVREVQEETGLKVSIKRLVSVYTNPHLLLEYADGNRWQLVILHFEAEPTEGEFKVNPEMTDIGYFTPAEMEQLEISKLDRLRVTDAFAAQAAVIVRDEF